MCGIIGIASTEHIYNKLWLSTSLQSLTHRGPDDAGEWWSNDNRIGLAHRRLSIIDLSVMGHQPMHHSKKGLSIVFNGEIYNHVELRNELKKLGHEFQSQNDTEVLLTAYSEWGIDCLNRFNGMFAFALFDAFDQKLFLVRDRAGEKPLFYHQNGNTLFFTSELKALLANPALPRNICFGALDYYLSYGYVPGSNCILKNYNKLPPAHVLSFDLTNGNTNIWCYWKVPEFKNSFAITDINELLFELEGLLEDSVSRQLIADVPIGILLSGGVDSSLVTAMAVRNSSQVKTFSIGFPGHGALDETPHSRLIAKYFGTDHTELVAEPMSVDLIAKLAYHFDEPINDSSMIPTWIVSNLVSKYCKVAIGGDGGDELFGGYSVYSNLIKLKKYLRLFPISFRKILSKSSDILLPVGLKGRNFLKNLDMDLERCLPLQATFFDTNSRMQLMQDYPEHLFVAEEMKRNRIPKINDLIQRATRMDFQDYLTEDILVKVDRASMMNSLEVRSPFLDYRIIEFAYEKVPVSLKVNENEKKILLKKLVEKILPSEFDKKRKQGFSIPLAKWLEKGPYKDFFWEVLLDNTSMFNKKTVEKLLKGQQKGFSNGDRLFGLLIFELWRREFKVSV
jgi:asparagine synthase (glutamine-hydrolysing)